MNPYRGTNLISFFGELASRLWLFITGQLSFSDLASDEIQLLALGGLAVSAALVGSFLVLRRMTMLAHSLSHTMLLGIVIAFLLVRGQNGEMATGLDLKVLGLAALLTALVTTFLTELLRRSFRLAEDAANGLVFTTLFAVGVLLVTLFTRSAHVGAELIMGSADGLHPDDLKLVGWVLLGNIVLSLLLCRAYSVTTFDPIFARSIGFSVTLANYILMAQTAATAIGGFRSVGVLMILAFIVAPPLAARQFTHRLSRMLILACLIGLLAAILGVATTRHLLSVYHLAISTSGLVVCYLTLFVGLSLITKLTFRPKVVTLKG